MHSMGGNPDHVINSWFLNYPDTASSSVVFFRGYDTVSTWYKLWGSVAINGPNAYVDSAHGVTTAMVNPALRYFDVRNNSYFWPQKYLDFVKSYNDTVATKDSVDVPNGTANEVKMYLKRRLYLPTWVNTYTQWTADSLAGKLSSNVKIANNQNADPGFPAGVTSHIDSLIAYVWKICTGKLDISWFYPNHTLYPPTWPLPENLAYTNAGLQHAGTDGFALGDLNWFPTQKAAWLLTDVKSEGTPVPVEYTLAQNYPNPFNPSTKVEFSLPRSSYVTLKVFNLLGEEVAALAGQNFTAGSYRVDWNAKGVASGVYFYRLVAGAYVETKKMLLLR
jgi:hypothetical protein